MCESTRAKGRESETLCMWISVINIDLSCVILQTFANSATRVRLGDFSRETTILK